MFSKPGAKPPQGVRFQLLFAKCSCMNVHKAVLIEISAAHSVVLSFTSQGVSLETNYGDQAISSFNFPFWDDVWFP